MQDQQRVDVPDPASAIAGRVLAIFGALGLRNTRPRRLIAEQLADRAAAGADFTAQELWHELQEAEPSLGRATVYRAIDLLVSEGVLDRVPFMDGTHRYRVCGASHHHHVTCTQCQRTVEIAACIPPELLAAIATNTDFDIEGHSLELFGRCAECREDEQRASLPSARAVRL